MCDMIFAGVFERHPRLTLAIVEFELAWAPNVLSSMDYTYRERHGEAIYRFKNGMLSSNFFRRNVVLSFQEDAIGIRLRDVIGVDNMMWGSDYPHSSRRFPNHGRSSRRSWPGCRTTNWPSLPWTAIRGSPATTPPARTNLTWRGLPSMLEGSELACVFAERQFPPRGNRSARATTPGGLIADARPSSWGGIITERHQLAASNAERAEAPARRAAPLRFAGP